MTDDDDDDDDDYDDDVIHENITADGVTRNVQTTGVGTNSAILIHQASQSTAFCRLRRSKTIFTVAGKLLGVITCTSAVRRLFRQPIS